MERAATALEIPPQAPAARGAPPRYAIHPVDPAAFSTHRICELRHNFHEHPLMQLPELARLAKDLYERGFCRFIKPGTTQTSDHASFINDNFVKEVASKLSNPGESDDVEGIDFDIFTYSQDPDYEQIRKTIKSEVKQADDANGVIRVTFTQYGDEIAVEYHLKKSGERWLIDDVVYPNDDFSLRSGLDLK